MKKLLFLLSFTFFAAQLFAQNNITNTLGTGGLFTIKDASSTFLTLDQSTGYLGIGTTAPVGRLHLFTGPQWSNANYGADLIVDGVRNNAIALLDASSGNPWAISNAGGVFGISQMPALGNTGTSPTTRLAISTSGNVGIGTTSPSGKLEVVTGSSLSVGLSSQTSGSIAFANNSDGAILPTIVGKGTTLSGLEIIGASSDAGASLGDIAFNVRENDNTDFSTLTTPAFKFTRYATDLVTILRNGNVGIGTTDPTVPLYVATSVDGFSNPNSNSIAKYFNATDASTSLTYNTSDFGQFGNISIYAAGNILTASSFIAASDRRIKTDIKNINGPLDIIKKLRPVQYTKIDKLQFGNRLNFGFIAQEVEKVIPNAVNTGKGEVPVLKPFEKVKFEDGVTYTILVKNGDDIKEQKYTTADPRPQGEIIVKSKEVNDFKSLSYDMIFTVAVGAIQEQQKEIDELKAQNAALVQKADAFDQLKAEVENLKKMITKSDIQLSSNQK